MKKLFILVLFLNVLLSCNKKVVCWEPTNEIILQPFEEVDASTINLLQKEQLVKKM